MDLFLSVTDEVAAKEVIVQTLETMELIGNHFRAGVTAAVVTDDSAVEFYPRADPV